MKRPLQTLPARLKRLSLSVWILHLYLALPLLICSQPPRVAVEASMDPAISSPNALSLGKFGEIPVSPFTGSPLIEVPLTTIEYGDIRLPLTLKYDASGCRPESQSGWVGLNWSLVAGGLIRRQQNGLPDELIPLPVGTAPDVHTGYLDKKARLSTTDWATLPDDLNSGIHPVVDLNPDEFSFTFGNFSGTFLMNHLGEWVVKGAHKGKIKIVPHIEEDYTTVDPNGVTHTLLRVITGFTVTVPDGTRYVFGGGKAIEFSKPALPTKVAGYNSQGPPRGGPAGRRWWAIPYDNYYGDIAKHIQAHAWWLSEIISPEGRTVRFAYAHRFRLQQANYSNISLVASAFGEVNTYDVNMVSQTLLTTPLLQKITVGADRSYVFEVQEAHDLAVPFFTKPQTQDSFEPYSRGVDGVGAREVYEKVWGHDKLAHLTVHLHGRPVRRFAFEYLENAAERLKLRAIHYYGAEEDTAEKSYRFEYHPQRLPASYTTGMKDHWGYYNGNDYWEGFRGQDPPDGAGYTEIPDLQAYAHSRAPDGEKMQAEVLTKIIYPTGGHSEFSYEPHDYRSVVKYRPEVQVEPLEENRIAGGLRIKQVMHDSGEGSSITKRYFYVKNSSTGGTESSGVLAGEPAYYSSYAAPFFVFSSNPLNYHNTTNGSHITYSEVREETAGNGSLVYHYTNFDNGYLDTEPFDFRSFPEDADYATFHLEKYKAYGKRNVERGLLLRLETYDREGGLKREVIHTYNNSSARLNEYVRAISKVRESPFSNIYLRMSASYPIYTYDPYLVSTTTTEYFPGAEAMVTTTAYTYNSYGLTASKTETDSKGDTFSETYHYAPDLIGSEQFPLMEQLTQAHRIAEPVIIEKYLNGHKLSEYHVKYGASEETGYRPQPIAVYERDGGGSIDLNAATDRRLEIVGYDGHGKVREYKQDGVSVTQLWGYNREYLIAKLVNATYAEVEVALSSSDLALLHQGYHFIAAGPPFWVPKVIPLTDAEIRNLLARLRTSLPQAQVTTYTYHPLVGRTSETQPNGRTVYYEYDPFHRLKAVKDEEGKVVQQFEYHYAQGASGTENSLKTITARQALSGDLSEHSSPIQTQQQVWYYDGLGRPLQSVRRWGSPEGHDVVTPYVYDRFGRQEVSYLPYAAAQTTGQFIPTATVEEGIQRYYSTRFSEHDGRHAYAKVRFEASPLNRVLEQASPGYDWRMDGGHTLTTAYGTNTAADQVRVYRYDGRYLRAEEDYAAGALHKTTVTDEDGNVVVTFTDKRGRMILKRACTGEAWADTYHVHDGLQQLRVVLPPEVSKRVQDHLTTGPEGQRVVAEGFLATWAFRYGYDARGRKTSLHVPGAEPVYLVYDRWDRLVLTQDGEQRKCQEWLFRKYDAFNRPVITGICTDHRTAAAIQEALHQARDEARSETYTGTGTTKYTNTAFPTDVEKFLTLTYYDSYAFRGGADYRDPGFPTDAEHLASQRQEEVQGLLTGTLTDDGTGTGRWLETVTYYDHKHRPIQVVAANHLGGEETTSHQYDFTGNLRRSRHTHTTGEGESLEVTQAYTYDHADRLIDVWHQLGPHSAKVLLAHREYNELGELVSKHLHYEGNEGADSAPDASAFAQKVDYAYNIRGWLTRINDGIARSGQALFGLELSYNEGGQYNGNISQLRWSSSQDLAAFHEYVYAYDGLNRLLRASYRSDLHTGLYDVGGPDGSVGYDLNGNLLHLLRRGLITGHRSEVIDDLSYTYEGNQLRQVSDSAGTAGFKDGSNAGDDYTYDANGNMTRDLNKGITSVEYNYLNLPTRVDWEAGRYQLTTYDANGVKLQKRDYKADTLHRTIDYVGEFVYVTEGSGQRKLQQISHEEGRVVPLDDGSFSYEYHLRDHLGNVRVTFSTTPENYEMEATMEDSNEQTMFSNYVATSDGAVAKSGTHVFRNSSTMNGGLGMNTFLGVNKGDTIKASAYAYYNDAGGSYNLATGLIERALFGSFGANYDIEGATVTQTNFDNAFASGTALGDRSSSSSAPPAYINYLVFDKEMNFVTASFTQITAASNGTMALVTAPDYIADREGYVMVYLSNETQGSELVVSWDDLKVYHSKTNVVESSDFYPGGAMFNRYERIASTPQNFKFQGHEWMPELRVFDLGPRGWDPYTWRTNAQDILADQFPDQSPYSLFRNNPVRFIDPDGMAPIDIIGGCCGIPGYSVALQNIGNKVRGAISTANARASAMNRAHTRLTGESPGFLTRASHSFTSYFHSFGSYTDAEDVSVLTQGRTVAGNNATGLDYTFAVAGAAIPFVSGGAIKNIFRVSADVANARHIANGMDVPFDASKPIHDITLSQDQSFVRVFKEGYNNPSGEFITSIDAIKGLSPEEVKNTLGLNYVPDRMADVNVPAGTTIRTGTVAKRPKVGVDGGGFQIQLQDRIPEDSFNNIREFK